MSDLSRMTSVSLELEENSLQNASPKVASPLSKQPPKSSSSKGKLLKAVFAVLLITGVVAAVGVCAIVLGTRSGEKLVNDGYIETDNENTAEDLLNRRMTEQGRLTRRAARRSRLQGPSSCYSLQSNDTIPAAHVRGYGSKFPESTPSPSLGATSAPVIPGQNTKWECNDKKYGPAFVEGGMIFNQTDKSLYVPTCGYYHISSQVFFAVRPNQPDDHVQHSMRVQRNCNSDSNPLVILGRSYVKKHSEEKIYTTSSTEGIVKICAGGTIQVIVPNDNPCCGSGVPREATFMTAFLIKETPCDKTWPPEIFDSDPNSS